MTNKELEQKLKSVINQVGELAARVKSMELKNRTQDRWIDELKLKDVSLAKTAEELAEIKEILLGKPEIQD